jgi:hypothetical protein
LARSAFDLVHLPQRRTKLFAQFTTLVRIAFVPDVRRFCARWGGFALNPGRLQVQHQLGIQQLGQKDPLSQAVPVVANTAIELMIWGASNRIFLWSVQSQRRLVVEIP